MGKRRKDRELALQLLFSLDINRIPIGTAVRNFKLLTNSEPTPFFSLLVNGVNNSYSDIDNLIRKASENWTIDRMSAIDRNILRIGVYEILYCEDIPAKVTINEAVDISKKFGTYDSGAFINGILDKINKEAINNSGVKTETD